MKNRWGMKAAAVFVCALLCCLFCACAQSEGEEQTAQEKNRAYMSQMNQITEDLKEGFAEFTDAVSRNDLVAMKTQAENAYKKLDELKGLEVPEGLEDIQKAYEEGSASLKEALQGYIDLYTELDGAGPEGIDASSYGDRLAKIQEAYDKGIEQLGAGDKLASEKE